MGYLIPLARMFTKPSEVVLRLCLHVELFALRRFPLLCSVSMAFGYLWRVYSEPTAVGALVHPWAQNNGQLLLVDILVFVRSLLSINE